MNHSLSISLQLATVFGALGVHYIYLQIFLRDHGFSYEQIGFFLAVIPMLAMVASPLWGMVADSSRDPRRVLWTVLILAPACHLLLLGGTTFSLCLAVCAGIALFYQPIIPVQDSLILRALHLHGGDYGRLRIWGSIGFAVPALLLPLVWGSPEMGSINWRVPALVFYGYSALALLFATQFPKVPPERKHGLSMAGLKLLENRTFVVLLGCVFIARLAASSLDGYQTLYFQEMGVPVRDLALYLSLGPLSEVVTIFYSQRWLARFGARKLMAVCLMVLAFRLLVTASSSNHWVLVLIQISHCLTFGTQHVVTLLVVNQLAGDAIRASAQTLTMVFSSYLSRLVGLAACGLIAGQVGIPALFCISAGLALLSLVLWLWLYHDTEETLVRERIR